MFFFLSKLIDVVFSPYSWGLVLLAAAVPWRVRLARRWRRRRAFGIAGLALLAVASTAPASNALLWSLEHASTPTYRDEVTYDAVILLGGISDEEVNAESGQPAYNDNVERVIMTHRLLRDGKARVAIVSAGTLHPELAAYNEAVILGRQLEDWGIAKDRILIEDKALNTRDNAVYAQQIARAHGLERVLVLTSAFHMTRAAECFAAVGMKVDTFAVDYRARAHTPGGIGDFLPRAGTLAVTTTTLREIAGRWIYRMQGYGKRVP